MAWRMTLALSDDLRAQVEDARREYRRRTGEEISVAQIVRYGIGRWIEDWGGGDVVDDDPQEVTR